ncbi:MAG TPA: hypothetical protein VGR01_19755 [Burkholderiales bacterium]|jgi:hypothetical protein|nr:hypothetical protein [Burkholderiales bacterium]
MKSPKPVVQPERLAYTVNQTLGTGAFPTRNKLYDAITRGDVVSWKDGRSRMISAESLREYVRRRERRAREEDPGRPREPAAA